MTDTDYNGWKNRETWNANLWLSNEEPLYRHCRELAQSVENNGALADEIEGFALQIWPKGKTPDGDRLSLVYWQEIADAFCEQ